MPVTWFKDYLTYPFRFYLRHILGMEALDDEKTEMNVMDFGSMVHHALQRMAENEQMCQCRKKRELSDFLCAAAEEWIAERFGPSPPLQIRIQFDAARRRLEAAAQVQARLIREGWEILEHETKIEAEIHGMRIIGRIDRIDRHRKTGHIRILDYKTSDKAITPSEDHLSSSYGETRAYAKVSIDSREKRWGNLQLPLYRILLANREEFQGTVELGYFNLPKALNETGVNVWEGFNEELLQSARVCAEGIVEDVQ
ncbi:MAG: ATP-dependent nuclease subunit B, partial [Chloroflexi bacterium CG07_land_8_20_14_0_80_51_10]